MWKVTQNNFPFMHVSSQIYKHVKNKNGVPHCRSRYFVFMWTRKNRRQNRKKSRKKRRLRQFRWTTNMIKDLLNCLYSSVIHILRCSTNKINFFISVRSNTKGNDRIISRAVARRGGGRVARGAIAPKASKQFLKRPNLRARPHADLFLSSFSKLKSREMHF